MQETCSGMHEKYINVLTMDNSFAQTESPVVILTKYGLVHRRLYESPLFTACNMYFIRTYHQNI